MIHEVIRKLKDGSSIKVIIDIHVDSREAFYSTRVETKAKRKRTWLPIVNEDNFNYREASMSDRIKYINNENKKVVGVELLNQALLEAWNKIKPAEVQDLELEYSKRK